MRVAQIALAVAVPFVARAQPAPSCAAIELTLPHADTLAAALRPDACGPLRVVITRPPARISPGMGIYMPERHFSFDIALENIGDTAVRIPERFALDSVSFVRYGRVHGPGISWAYGRVSLSSRPERGARRRFAGTTGDSTLLEPGARSTHVTISLEAQPLATGFILWLGGDERTRPVTAADSRFPPEVPPLPLDDRARRLIEDTAFPRLRQSQVLYTDARRALQFFSVSFGEGHDCPGGCFYSSAIGVRFGARSGWLQLSHYDADTALDARVRAGTFNIGVGDDYLLSQELANLLERNGPAYGTGLSRAVRSIAVKHPRVPRARLVRMVEAQFTGFRDGLLSELLASPRVTSDIELLTALAYLPRGYDFERGTARGLLMQQAARLIEDSTTSSRTLFAIRGALYDRDSLLVRRLVAHPNARYSVAILASLSFHFPWVRPQLLASVQAPPEITAQLAAYLNPETSRQELGMELLQDSRTANDERVLTFLAHIGHQEVRWAACRRLPEDAILCAEDFPLRAVWKSR